jgi:hypothetical protein
MVEALSQPVGAILPCLAMAAAVNRFSPSVDFPYVDIPHKASSS